MSGIGNTVSDPSQNFVDPNQRSGPQQEAQQIGADGTPTTKTDCSNGTCGKPSTGSANGSCSGGSCGGGKMAHSRAGGGSCSTGSCGGEKQAKAGKAEKSDCADGKCNSGSGAKATMMTVAGMELAQLTIDYSQYMS